MRVIGSWVSGFLILNMLVACGYSPSKVQNSSDGSIYFTSGLPNTPLNIYVLDTTNFSSSPMYVSSENKDLLLLFNPLQNRYFAVKRFNSYKGDASVVTKFNLGHKIEWERNNLPVNVFTLVSIPDENHLITIGNQQGELTTLSEKGEVISPKASLSLTNGSLALEDLRLVGGAYSLEEEFFVVAGGMTADFKATQAKVHKLSSDRKTIKSSVDIPKCKNVSDLPTGFRALGKSSFVVVCNPQYRTAQNDVISIVHADVASGSPVFKVLKTQTSLDGAIKGYSIKGASADNKWIFVEELKDVSLLISRRNYWLNVENGQEKEIKNYGGSFFYDRNTLTYIFGCVKEGHGSCKDKSFAVVRDGEFLTDQVFASRTVNFENTFTGFANIFY